MSTYRGRLTKELQDEDYRYAYDEEFANSRMATQIKVIREQRNNMTQAQLAEKAGMRQSRISALENVDYSAWSISTLRRLARALGVRLSFKFESWGELLSEVDSFSRKTLQRPDFENDSAFGEQALSVDDKAEKATVRIETSTPVGIISALPNRKPYIKHYKPDRASAVNIGRTQEEVWQKIALSR